MNFKSFKNNERTFLFVGSRDVGKGKSSQAVSLIGLGLTQNKWQGVIIDIRKLACVEPLFLLFIETGWQNGQIRQIAKAQTSRKGVRSARKTKKRSQNR